MQISDEEFEFISVSYLGTPEPEDSSFIDQVLAGLQTVLRFPASLWV